MIIDMPTVSMGNSGKILPADKVSYNNATSGLSADNVQGAIDEVNSNLTASDGLNFRFSTDGEGNYGYLKGDDTFVPFKGGSIEPYDLTLPSNFNINSLTDNTEYKAVASVSGDFTVNSKLDSKIFLTGLPKPKTTVANAGTISTKGSSSSVEVDTDGNAKIVNYNGFSAGFTWTFDIVYILD